MFFKGWVKRLSLVSIVLLGFFLDVAAQDAGGDVKLRFGGGYDSLSPEQQELVRKWHGEYEAITGRQIDPKISYDNLALSTRTTFDAVTHALLGTKLTDGSTGQSLGNALDLVNLVESVHGEINKARGDQQYRIYVLLKENALDVLYRCKEFKRVGDNTIYHIGYPINFRQQGGAPSIQISVTRTGYRADIDVDYRPSGGPRALVNGHLTSANSDVRAGKNYFNHVRRWQGLGDWWRSLFGITTAIPQREITALSSGNNPPRLRGSIPVQDAINDFFKAWLLEDKPEQALGYISVKALACIAEFPGGGTSKSSLVRLRIYKRMKETNQIFGDVNNLDQVMQGVVIPAPDGIPMTQEYGRLFSLQRIPDDVAREMDCRIRQNMELAAPIPRAAHRIGDFYNAITILGRKEKGTSGQILSQVWTREEGAWKLVSWQMENPFNAEKRKTEVAATTQPNPALEPADSALLNKVQSFLGDWLLQKKYDTLQTYFAPEALPCAELEAEDHRKVPERQERAELRKWLADIGNEAGQNKRIAQTIKSVPFGHPHMQEVSHPDQDSYLMTRISDDLAVMDGCTARERGTRLAPNVAAGDPTYDSKTYQVAFQLRKGDVQAGTVEFNWALRDGNWKIIAFDLLTD
jgi:hypothetical protein